MLETVWITNDTSKCWLWVCPKLSPLVGYHVQIIVHFGKEISMGVSLRWRSPLGVVTSEAFVKHIKLMTTWGFTQHHMLKVVEESFSYEDVIYNFEMLWQATDLVYAYSKSKISWNNKLLNVGYVNCAWVSCYPSKGYMVPLCATKRNALSLLWILVMATYIQWDLNTSYNGPIEFEK